jgi:hypothetical protein
LAIVSKIDKALQMDGLGALDELQRIDVSP